MTIINQIIPFFKFKGIVNIPGRILFGFLADLPKISPMALNTISVLIGAFPLLAYDQLLQQHTLTQYAFGALYALSTCKLF